MAEVGRDPELRALIGELFFEQVGGWVGQRCVRGR